MTQYIAFDPKQGYPAGTAGGSVSAHVKFPVPEGAFFGTFDSGEHADFRWRVVNATGTFDVRTPCVVLTGK